MVFTSRISCLDQEGIELEVNRIDTLYRNSVLTQRVRTVRLPGRKCHPQIMYTFLGFEIKVGIRRLTCPDITSARYLMIFVELGMDRVHIPYDPTQTAVLVPELEQSFHRIKELLLKAGFDSHSHGQMVRRVYQRLRSRLRKADHTATES